MESRHLYLVECPSLHQEVPHHQGSYRLAESLQISSFLHLDSSLLKACLKTARMGLLQGSLECHLLVLVGRLVPRVARLGVVECDEF